MNSLVGTDLAYLATSIALTVWGAHGLHKNGRQFLVDSFIGDANLADSINHLLIVGFYPINIGYIAMALKSAAEAESLHEVVETVSTKVGLVMLILAAMHFLNPLAFARWRRRAILPPARYQFLPPRTCIHRGPEPGRPQT